MKVLMPILSLLLRLAAIALAIITGVNAWLGNGLGLLQWLIAAVLWGVAEVIEPTDNKKTDKTNEMSAPIPESAPTPDEFPAQPEQTTITCGQCGQPMLIPHTNEAVKITCPKCGNSFIHTN